MTISEYIIEKLIDYKITDVFGVVGGGSMYLNDEVCKAVKKNRMKFYAFHNEQAASYAAESYARLKNRPCCLMVTSGPGSTHAIPGVAAAYTESLPMVVISGQMQTNHTTQYVMKKDGKILRSLGDQEIDILNIVNRITKYHKMLRVDWDGESKSLDQSLEYAFNLCEDGRKGPVWIDVPLDVQKAEIGEQYNPPPTTIQKGGEKEFRIREIKEVKKLLEKSKSPVILAGTAVRSSGGLNEFDKLVNKLNIPVVTSFNAYDIMDHSDKYNYGKQGVFGDRAANIILNNADVLLILGCRCEPRQIGYQDDFAKKAFKIMVDIDRNELTKPTINIQMPIERDLKDFMSCLNKKTNYIKRKERWLSWCDKIYDKYSKREYAKYENGIDPYEFYDKLSDMLNKNDIVVTANGGASVMGSQCIKIKKGQRFYTNGSQGPMGYGLPAAIGAYIASGKKKRIICLEGDGSIMQNIQELSAIKHMNKTGGANIKIFVLNNGGYSSIKQTQDRYFNGRRIGCGEEDIEIPSFSKVADAFFGGNYFKITTMDGIKEELEYILKIKHQAIVEIVVDPESKFMPRVNGKGLENMWPNLSEKELKENKFNGKR